ncbi:hypothetical protein QYM36_019384 [Artemia franciscana]|uniref:Uncharacterized protein n=1 Tax=Artemia franciscana TaxID=6661 RepID=A0AA88KT37_ARTSF|nr:hypothetical protein QYM36_019384 [Artemia franciscana]
MVERSYWEPVQCVLPCMQCANSGIIIKLAEGIGHTKNVTVVEKTVPVKAFTGSNDKERVHKNVVKSAEM